MHPFIASLFLIVKDNFKPFFFPQVTPASRTFSVPVPIWIDYPLGLVILEVSLHFVLWITYSFAGAGAYNKRKCACKYSEPLCI